MLDNQEQFRLRPLDDEAPVVTVIVCAYNEEKFLSRTLHTLSVQNATFPYEIVVVDNNSTDRTADVAKGYDVKVVLCENRGKIPALRAGLDSSSGSIVAIADADTGKNWGTLLTRLNKYDNGMRK